MNTFSADYEKVRYGAGHYYWNKQQATVMQKLYRFYALEEFIDMPYTYAEFEQEFKQEMFQEFKEDFLRQCTTEERLEGFDAEERLRGLAGEEVLHSLFGAQLQDLTTEQRVVFNDWTLDNMSRILVF